MALPLAAITASNNKTQRHPAARVLVNRDCFPINRDNVQENRKRRIILDEPFRGTSPLDLCSPSTLSVTSKNWRSYDAML